MKTEIKFYAGLNTIGGVVMSITYGKERILLEIGTHYNPATEVFDGVVKPRNNYHLYDDLYLKRIPLVEGLYPKEYIKDFDLLAAEDSDLHTSIFITHLHLDHMSCMGLVDDSVDIYCSAPLLTIEEALEATGNGVKTIRNKGYTVLDPTHTYLIGDISVKPFLLNDKSYQDFSFYIQTPDLKLHYTGDVMLHGDYEKAVWEEMEYLKKEEIDVLVCETTSFMDSTMKLLYEDPETAVVVGKKELPEGMLNKQMVDAKLLDVLKQKTGLCVFNYYQREMSDVIAFSEMAEATNRTIVFEPETAYIVWKFFHKPVSIYIPDFKFEGEWFDELINNNPIITKAMIHENPRGYLLQNSYEYIMELFDLPNQDATYLHSGGKPMGEFDPAYQNLKRILNLAGFTHTNFFMDNFFTHAYPSQLKYYCDQIDAKVLVPVHGNNPERLHAKEGRLRLLPKQYQSYVFEDGMLKEKE